jgi:hypothetical protein
MDETPRNEELPILVGAAGRALSEKIKLALEDVKAQLALYSAGSSALVPLTETTFDEFMPAIVGHYGTCASEIFESHMEAYLAQYSYFFHDHRECLTMLDQIKRRAWEYARSHFDRWLTSVCEKLEPADQFRQTGIRQFSWHVNGVLNGKDLEWCQRAVDAANSRLKERYDQQRAPAHNEPVERPITTPTSTFSHDEQIAALERYKQQTGQYWKQIAPRIPMNVRDFRAARAGRPNSPGHPERLYKFIAALTLAE